MNYLTNYYKNLSEQLQEKVNHLQKLLNENSQEANGSKKSESEEDLGPDFDPQIDDGRAERAYNRKRHQRIVTSIVLNHALKYPHKNVKGGFKKDAAASAIDIEDFLNKHPRAPFTDPLAAIHAIHPIAIAGNYGLEHRIYRDYPDRTMGRDITELPQREYEELVMDNERKYVEELRQAVGMDITLQDLGVSKHTD